jgi:hypothetical protein
MAAAACCCCCVLCARVAAGTTVSRCCISVSGESPLQRSVSGTHTTPGSPAHQARDTHAFKRHNIACTSLWSGCAMLGCAALHNEVCGPVSCWMTAQSSPAAQCRRRFTWWRNVARSVGPQLQVQPCLGPCQRELRALVPAGCAHCRPAAAKRAAPRLHPNQSGVGQDEVAALCARWWCGCVRRVHVLAWRSRQHMLH